MNSKERFFAVVNGEAPDRLPVYPLSMMVAADLIEVPYRQNATDFREQSRGQVAFAEKFHVDHVSAISDPATEAADCGAAVIYQDNQPPALDEGNSLLADKSVLAGLVPPDPGSGPRMSNRLRVIEELRSQVGSETVVEGWIEGPIAEASDLRGINRFMMDLFDDPTFVADLLEFVYELGMTYARAQVEAGADVIGIGDAACSLIGGDLYQKSALEYHKRIVAEVHKLGALTRLHICGDSSFILPHLAEIGTDIVDLDSPVSVAQARADAGDTVVLTGNIDPVSVLKDGSVREIVSALDQCFKEAGESGYMVAAGCEIPRDTPDENILALHKFAGHALS